MKRAFLFVIVVLVIAGCQNADLIKNSDRLKDIDRMLNVQKELTSNSSLQFWKIFDQRLTKEEHQALQFLYAYMPLSDLADYSAEFMLSNVRQSLKAKAELPWGKRIPEEEFLHFVLPIRVNNENLDSFRLILYSEIKERIQGLSMKEAALEINHWCHEKVNYRGTDSRTSAPLSTIRKSFGRCGEESTFTVASMRTAGIPARQVYTPRWAHSDDNHAWVEVWIDGQWQYMGACEPDVNLDMGWFSEPSQRTMLVHTRAFGRYYGTEEVVTDEDRFSELNLTSRYARTKKVTVLVRDTEGQPVKNAKVEYKLYNYAEYYPIATGLTDENGISTLTTGLGDLIVWVSKEGIFDYGKLSVPISDTIRLTLSKKIENPVTENFHMTPPSVSKKILTASEKERNINNRRLSTEDSIRNKYMATFKDTIWIKQFAAERGLPSDTLTRIFHLCYGNWEEMMSFIYQNCITHRNLLFRFTDQLSGKDFSDTKAFTLNDHLNNISFPEDKTIDKEFFEKYILSPRIDLEILSPWRSFLKEKMGTSINQTKGNTVITLIGWIKQNIKIDTVANNHSRAPLTPIGVFNTKAADPLSRDIFFVSVCRTFAIPARLNPATRKPEYFSKGSWLSASFKDNISQLPEKGQLTLINGFNKIEPQYALHFSIAKITDGVAQTLEFEEGKPISKFESKIALETGTYLLVTGNRLTDASVLSSLTFFEIKKGEQTTLKVVLQQESMILKVLGKIFIDKIQIQIMPDKENRKLSALFGNDPAIIILFDPDAEPSKHILNDLGAYYDQFNIWTGKFIFSGSTNKIGTESVLKTYKIPLKSTIGIDFQDELSTQIQIILKQNPDDQLPVVMFCDALGNIYSISTGYRIGIGEQLLKIIHQYSSSQYQAQIPCTQP